MEDIFLFEIWRYLSVKDLYNYCRVNKQFHSIWTQNDTWKELLLADFKIKYLKRNAHHVYKTIREYETECISQRHVGLNGKIATIKITPNVHIPLESYDDLELLAIYKSHGKQMLSTIGMRNFMIQTLVNHYTIKLGLHRPKEYDKSLAFYLQNN